MNTELYWNDDHTKYAVLVSRGFGAGWATWNDMALAYDKRVVEFWLAHKDDEEWMRAVTQSKYSSVVSQSKANKEAVAFFHSIGYDNCPFMGGFTSISLEWVLAGKMWRLDEYDESESLVFMEDEDWICFN